MPKAVILMYHNIDVPPKGVRLPNLYVTPRMFRFQMGYLKAAGFKVMTVQDLFAAVEAGEVRSNLAAITFDDGYRDFYCNAYPVLRHHGYPSTVYVVTGLVSQDNAWDLRKEEVRKELMNWDCIAEVAKNGVQIGSHTRSHAQLTTLSGGGLREELVSSRKELEERLDRTVEEFCYPYGDYSEQVKEAVRQAGYRYAVTTRRGHVVRGGDPLELRRVPVKLITNPLSFLYKIHTDSERRKGKQP